MPAVRAVLLLFDTHLSAGEISAVQRVAPHEVRELWRAVQEEGSTTARIKATETEEAADRRGFLGEDRRAPVWP